MSFGKKIATGLLIASPVLLNTWSYFRERNDLKSVEKDFGRPAAVSCAKILTLGNADNPLLYTLVTYGKHLAAEHYVDGAREAELNEYRQRVKKNEL